MLSHAFLFKSERKILTRVRELECYSFIQPLMKKIPIRIRPFQKVGVAPDSLLWERATRPASLQFTGKRAPTILISRELRCFIGGFYAKFTTFILLFARNCSCCKECRVQTFKTMRPCLQAIILSNKCLETACSHCFSIVDHTTTQPRFAVVRKPGVPKLAARMSLNHFCYQCRCHQLRKRLSHK